MSLPVLLVLVSVVAVGRSQSQPFDATSYTHQILITGTGEGCEQEDDVHVTHCRTLDDVKDWSVSNSTAILLRVPSVKLSTYIPLVGVEHIAISGYPGAVTVECVKLDGAGAGFGFDAVQDIVLRDMTFENCGSLHNSTTRNTTTENSTVLFRSALYLVNCANAVFINVNFVNGTGRALSLFDTTGIVNITKCEFSLNCVPHDESDTYPGGGGVYVEFTYCPPGVYNCNTANHHNKDSVYSLHMCTFTSNYAQSLHIEITSTARARGTNFQGMGRGGGIGVFFKGDAQNNRVHLYSCTFFNNSGIWGGAMYVVFQDSSMGNVVQVYESEFLNNTAYGKGAAGGGAVNAGLLFFDSDSPHDNHLHFHHCNFTENEAVYGGGVGLFSSLTKQYSDPINSICFDDCVWTGNRAEYGSAVDVSPDIWNTLGIGVLPSVTLKDCKFLSNAVKPFSGNLSSDDRYASEYFPGRGVFAATAFPVEFGGDTVFRDNDGTAVYITSTVLVFRNMSSVTFVSNTGIYGGAVALIGYSSMLVNDDSTFTFTNNTSSNFGGAIYFMSINVRYSFSSLSCFIQYQGDHDKLVSLRNINFTFDGNLGQDTNKTCSKIGNSIFATSLKPCFRACSGNDSEVSQPERAMECIANFTFLDNIRTADCTSFEVSTVGAQFEMKDNSSLPLEIVPGQTFPLPFEILDDFGNVTSEVYRVSVLSPSITVGDSNLYTASSLTLYGNPGDNGSLVFLTRGFRSVAISIEVEMQRCPPGFILLNSSEGLPSPPKCVCSANMEQSYRYRGIMLCNSSQYIALLKNGYWIGYQESIDDDLVSGFCPARLCSQDNLVINDKTFRGYYKLPEKASQEDLDIVLCGEKRMGRVCGSCRENYSVYFHSYNFLCGNNTNLCFAGWLIYLVSELIPLTILFLFVMVLGVSFTSGALNGFIFFAQVFDSLTIDAQGFLLTERKELQFLIRGSRFIYRFLNLEFFSTDELSFCLWKGATALDILVFKYVTVLYALLLVMASVLVMKYCTCYTRCCRWITPRTVRSSVIHGLSTFLVMCYTQVTAVSFYILTPINLYSKGNTPQAPVVAYQGQTEFFSKEHLPYAIPALFCLMTLVAIPPVLLISYPLYYRLFSLLHSCGKLKPFTRRVSESKWLETLSLYISIGRMKPLLDSFQSCFKDEFRFFAGLYFVYRIAIHGARVFMTSVAQFYTIIELELLIILTLHSLAQPYQKRRHNVLDSLLFLNMAVINGMTLYNYSVIASNNYTESDIKLVTTLISMQVILVYLPLLYIVLFLGFKVAKYLQFYYKQRKPTDENDPASTSVEDFQFPERMLEEECSQSEYHTFGGNGHSPV